MNNTDAKRIPMVPHDPTWSGAFAVAAQEIRNALGQNLLEIHHIGSTSIPGIFAKPVIDMLGVVADLAVVDQHTMQMQSLGYEVMGEFGIPGRRYFRHDNAVGDRTHQFHAFQLGSTDVQRHLAFRDFLRAHPAIAAQYSDLKRRLVKMHPTDMNAYMDGKDSFIKDVQQQALRWAAADR